MIKLDTTNEILSRSVFSIDPTMTMMQQIKYIIALLEQTILNDVEGDVVELGCCIGESAKYTRMMLDYHNSNKQFYVYDSFEGLPKPGIWEPTWREGALKTSEDIFKLNFTNNNLVVPNIVKGWFCDIQDNQLPEKISFAFLDGDFYQSIYDSFVKIYPRLSKGAIVTIHDYERFDLPGVKKAVEDFMTSINHTEPVVFKICDQLGVYIHI